MVNPEIVEEIRRIRKKDATYSAKKIRPILLRYYEDYEVPYIATISNVIKRHNFFFRPNIKSFKKRSKSALKAAARKRLSGNLHAKEPNKVVEFDMKHIRIPCNGTKYAFVGIDVCSKQATIHVSNTCTSYSGRTGYQKAVARFGKDALYVNDNGSENQDKTELWLKNEKITQLWARPRTPKDKPCVERMIGTLQKECLNSLTEPMTVAEIQEEIDKWLKKYHSYRPHESLDFLTPDEFLATFYLHFSSLKFGESKQGFPGSSRSCQLLEELSPLIWQTRKFCTCWKIALFFCLEDSKETGDFCVWSIKENEIRNVSI